MHKKHKKLHQKNWNKRIKYENRKELDECSKYGRRNENEDEVDGIWDWSCVWNTNGILMVYWTIISLLILLEYSWYVHTIPRDQNLKNNLFIPT